MKREQVLKFIARMGVYIIGIIILALGITLNTKTNLGVSPIISMPFVVASIWGFDKATAIFWAYVIFLLLQIAILGKRFHPFQLLQVAASYLTSSFIAVFDRILPEPPEALGMRFLMLAAAILFTGIGAAVTVDAQIVPNPADGLARVLGELCKKGMGFGKNLFDLTAIVISLVIGLWFSGKPVGIGIGTVCAMIFTGRVIAVFNHFFKKPIEQAVLTKK